ncbi:proprotein convertase subtilisin/kexin type 4 [Python bivittatus]|uniref:Proprotein convertase subtilisin/kexin type 4 n=1 Tax=Python bivittatus TaxID=176946 RepID=A0A9F5J8H7_PYTBI|nr:proprotein convertase subtilisin/kexin type 4 [Python bivittatus]
MGVWLLLLLWCGASRAASVYLSSWAVRVPGGAQEAQRLARRHGLLYLGQVIEGESYYHLKHRGMAQKSLTQHWGWHLRLKREPRIPWFEQQTLKRRTKRTATVVPTDPWFHKQWYMNNDIIPDLNVLTAWSQGYTGLGVVVSILDDGIEKNHPDLVANYDPMASYDFNDNDPDPQPRYNTWNENRHGTRCAGEVAATASNHVCGAGIAYRAKIGGVRMLDGVVNDIVEAQSLSLHPQHIDIYSASWGPEDDGKTVDGPGVLAREAFRKGVVNGRGGLGSLFVWASGNGGLRKDDCNCDGYTNSIYTLSVGSATENGRVPWYNEACASTLTTTYSSGAKGEKQIVTTDLRHACTGSHTGTSASAPLAAGLIALALEANPVLTWRDMQHLVVRASSPAHLQADDWAVNGVGRKVSHYYGYGLLNAGALVEMAKRWTRTRPQQKCFIQVVYKPVGSRPPALPPVEILAPGQPHGEGVGASASPVPDPPGVWGCCLLAARPYDTSREGYKDWSFMSTHYWDEDPQGIWTLLLENKGDAYNTGFLKNFVLKLYGTDEDMTARQAAPPAVSKCARHSHDGTCQECPSPFFVVQHLCLSYCPPRYYSLSRAALNPNGTQRTIQACAACDPSCYTCLAGSAHNCTTCPSHSTYEERSHTCLQSPSFSYLPRGGVFALGDRHLLLLVVAILLGVGPVAFCILYALRRLVIRTGTWRKQVGPSAESGTVSLELLYLHHPGAKESLKRLS